MNIFAPINSVRDAEKLINLGADELYCGVNPQEWASDYRTVKTPNRRASDSAQVGSLAELRRIAEHCDEHDVPVYVTLNAHFYSERQFSLLERLVDELASWNGITGYIIADVHFMKLIADEFADAEILVSTGATVFNGQTATFLSEMGADGVHLPRHLTVDEIGQISRSAPPDFDLYAFMLNENCTNIDGNCTFLHDPPIEHEDATRAPCIQTFTERSLDGESEPKQTGLFRNAHRYPSEACGICALYRFQEFGLSGVKMVGRGLPLERKMNQVQLLDRVREVRDSASSKRKFKELVRSLLDDYGLRCDVNACYYPTVMEQ